MRSLERNISAVPNGIILFLLLSFVFQFSIKIFEEKTKDQFSPLKKLLTDVEYNVLSLGSNKLLTHMLTLKLQMHDNQSGRHINYKYLDYDELSSSLVQLQKMNGTSDYPSVLASRVFVNTDDKAQLRKIIQSVKVMFEVNPQINWRWLAETVILAKYHLNDLELALSMAQQIAKQPKSVEMPSWARDLEFLLLEELNQIESAIYIVENMLKNKQELSNDEIRFLEFRLSGLKQKSVE